MRRFNLCGKWMLSLSLLFLCRSFADSGDTIDYSNKIRCLLDTYIANFPKVEKHSIDVRHNFLWSNYRMHCRHHFEAKEATRRDIQVISIEMFKVEPEKKTIRGDIQFQVEIWTMKANTDANTLLKLLYECDEIEMLFTQKPPKQFFIYENFFVLVTAGPSNTAHVVYERANEIIKMCFE